MDQFEKKNKLNGCPKIFFFFWENMHFKKKKEKERKGKIQLASNPQGLQYMHHLET